jgi:hypothetical protein
MKEETKDISQSLAFIIDHMATKDDIDELKSDITELKLGQKILESKLSGIDKRLDIEAGMRSDQKIPARVVDLEVKVWGTSREPKLMVR